MGMDALMSEGKNWGGYPKSEARDVISVPHSSDMQSMLSQILDKHANAPFLPYGLGRSYGDVCLNNGGTLLQTSALTGIIHFDEVTGVINVGAGTSLESLLQHVIPKGWMLPVVPGTRHITIGGAVANDIHGKNHHAVGSFGSHVRSMVVWHNGELATCAPDTNPELFFACIGGMGLTGLIVSIEIRLHSISSSSLSITTSKVVSLETMIAMLRDADKAYTYTVGWYDVQRNRGHLQKANHLADGTFEMPALHALTVPAAARFLLNKPLIHFGNACYYHQILGEQKSTTANLSSFFFPLDILRQWNKAYQPNGLLQYQFVVPHDVGIQATTEIFATLRKYGVMINLTVVKSFGSKVSGGIMSFPMPGITVAMDMKNSSQALQALTECDAVVIEAGGRVYMAKDARLSARAFQTMYADALPRFLQQRDPLFSSSLWRRVMGESR